MKIKFKKEYIGAKKPTKGSRYAACFDLYIADIIKVNKENRTVTVSYGISLELPEGYKAVIVPRSSFSPLNWVMSNSPGQIDSDYRGELKSVFTSINNNMSFPYSVGDRAAQMYIEKVIDFEFEEIKELSTTERGEGGFGSSGHK